MKTDLLAAVEKLSMTPNAIYILLCLQKGATPLLVDIPLELKFLEEQEYLADHQLTSKAKDVLAKLSYLSKTSKSKRTLKPADLAYIESYRLLFPPGKLPSGSSSRSSVNELTPRFEWFFTKYPQYNDWNLILQATALYVDEYEQRNYEYMRNSENFIYKQDLNKIMKSLLADYCQQVVDGVDLPGSSSVPSIITIPGLND